MEEPMEPPPCRVRIIGGLDDFRRVVADVLAAIYSYNEEIRGSGYYLKPLHRVTRRRGGVRVVYEYYGRYWWRLERRGGKLRWIYLGTTTPMGLPDPPWTPIDGLSVKIVGDDVELDCHWLERLYELGLPRSLRVERVY